MLIVSTVKQSTLHLLPGSYSCLLNFNIKTDIYTMEIVIIRAITNLQVASCLEAVEDELH